MSTRIKMLQKVGSYAKGECYTIEDDKIAKMYIDGEYAEDAPAAKEVEPAEQLKALVGDMWAALHTEFASQVKSKGPRTGRIDGNADPDDPREPPTGKESFEVRQAKFGHFLGLIGTANSDKVSHVAKENAGNLLANTYKCLARMIDPSASPTNFGEVQKGQRFEHKAAQIEGSGPSLGYTVPPEFVTDIWKIAMEQSVLATRARKRPMSSNELRYPKLDQTHTQATGVTGYLGGVVARWTKETADRPETEPKLRQGTLKAGELTGYSIFGNELLQDSTVSLAAMIQELFGEAVGYYTDLSCLVGDGVDKPTGVVNAACTIKVTRASGANTQTLAFTDLTKMKRNLLPAYRKEAFWAITLGMEDALWNIVDANGRPLFLPNFPGTVGGPITANVGSGVQDILGLPYEVTEKLPIYGSDGDLMLIAPKGYMIGERMGLEIAASPHVRFLQNETVYRFVARLAGQPLLDAAFTALDGTTQASTFVALH